MTLDFQPTLEIDLSAIQANWRKLDGMNAQGAAAVVKANSYGLGMEQCAQSLLTAGAETFFVATLREGQDLRASLGQGPTIGVLEGLSDLSAFFGSDLVPVINTLEQAQAWRGQPKVMLHFDTGMNRLGLSPSDLPSLLQDSLWTSAQRPMLLSHLLDSDDPSSPHNHRQLKTFQLMRSQALSAGFEFQASLVNSSGHFLGEEYLSLGMGRPGLALYGGNPRLGFANPMLPVVTLTAPLIQVRDVAAKTSSGYGATWTSHEDTCLGVLPLGYADGWPRAASDRIEVSIDGILCPQVGRVSMDTVVIDLGALPPQSRKVGQTAEIIGETRPIEVFAKGANTLAYEVLTGLSQRAKRVYL